ncbi:MAG: A/G-specific adenine glycosylase [Candidatus Omnitrophica bacterium]|nr:A/G-specific adenine glycosylase [Candidatus Omnitrophota bacterium]
MKNAASFRRDLTLWFTRNARDLPWRRKRSPYATWISEVMLQQTQVKTATPFFERWMKALPDTHALARAPEQKILHLWQGLGYYSRARNLKRAAQHIIRHHDGRIPLTMKELLEVPGIGPYSAGAILSIGHNRKAPIADGNVLRVIARLEAIRRPIDEETTRRHILDIEAGLVPSSNPGRFNEALMELGALICTPKTPACGSCPVSRHCLAREKNLTARIPQKKRRILLTKVRAAAVILEHKNRFFLHRRPVGRIMGGLWEFPELKFAPDEGLTAAHAARLLKRHLGRPELRLRKITSLKRHYTRYAETLEVYRAKAAAGPKEHCGIWKSVWVPKNRLEEYPLSSAHARIRRLVLDADRGLAKPALTDHIQ